MPPRRTVTVPVQTSNATVDEVALARESLTRLAREIEAAEREKAQTEGAIQQISTQLQTEFSITSAAAAQEELELLDREIATKGDEFVAKERYLREEFEW